MQEIKTFEVMLWDSVLMGACPEEVRMEGGGSKV